MKILFFALIFAFSIHCCLSQPNEAVARLVKQGIAQHDKGDYAAAIKIYDEALQIDKDDYDANYEKSLSCLYAKRFDECITISKYLLEKHPCNADIKAVYSTYGSALDDNGNPEEGIKIFDKGIKRFPTYHTLYFNKGLTLARMKKWEDAIDYFLLALKYKPNHAGSLYYMALAQEHSNKVAAVLSCLTFLAVEPEGKRAATILQYLNNVMGSFAIKGKDGGSVISIDAGDTGNKRKENNFSTVQMMLGLTAAAAFTDSAKSTTATEKLSRQIQLLVESLDTGKKEGKGIYWDVYAPFFTGMKKKELIPVFAHVASITSGDERNIQWINANQDRLQEFFKWVGDYQWGGDK